MANQELHQLIGELLAATRSSREHSFARTATVVEERLPALLLARYAASESRPSEPFQTATLERLRAAVRETSASGAGEQDSAEALESAAHQRWQEIEETLAPHSNGHTTAWQRIAKVVTARKYGRVEVLKGARHVHTSIRPFALAVAAAIAIIVFIATHRSATTHREPVVARRNRTPHAPTSQWKPSIEQPTNKPAKESATQPPSHQTTEPPSHQTTQPPNHPATQPPSQRTTDPEYAEHSKVGTFVKVMGAPTITGIGKGERGSRVLKPSDGVYTAVRITTGDADKAELQFSDGTTLALNFNTTLEIPSEQLAVSSDQLAVSPTRPLAHSPTRPSEVKLLLGHLWAKVRKAPDQKFAVETPVATAAVRGTEFGLKVQRVSSEQSAVSSDPSREGNRAGAVAIPNGERNRAVSPSANQPPSKPATLEAVLTVKEGLVEFSNSLGKVEATAMTETVARPDSKPTDPKRLPSLKIFRMSSGRIYVETTSRLTFPNAAERLAYPLGWAGLSVKEVVTVTDQSPVTSNQSKTQARAVRVVRNSPAEKAALKVGDTVTAVNGKAISKASEVDAAIFSQPNARVDLTVLRGREEKRVLLTTTSPPDAAPMSRLSGSDARSLDETTRLLFEGKTDEAERALQQWLTRIQTYNERLDRAIIAAAHNNLGVLYETKDDMRTALQHYQRAVQSDPQTALYHFNRGMALKNIGNFERAQEELERATQLAPRWVAAPAELADVYTLLSRVRDALQMTDEAVRRNPESPEAWVMKCKVLMKERQPEEALVAALKASQLEPDYAAASGYVGDLHLDRRQLDETEKMARKAIELDPNFAKGYDLLGHVHHERRQFDEAEKMWRKFVELAPTDPNGYWHLGLLNSQRGQLDEAEKMLRKVIELDANYVLGYLTLSEVYQARSHWDEAEKMCRKVIDIDPKNPDGYLWLGWIYHYRRQWDKAEKAYREAADLAPDYASVYMGLVGVYQAQLKFDQAEKMLRKVIEVDPKNAHAHLCWLGSFYVERRQLDKAEKAYREAADLAPDYAYAYMSLGRLYQAQRKLDQAEEMYRKAGDKDPELRYVLGNYYRDGGQLDKAEQMYRKAVELGPTNPALLHAIAWRYLTDLHKREEAEKLWRKAIELAPKWALPYRGLGRIYQNQNKYDDALLWYRKVAELDPTHAENYAWMGDVYSALRQFDEAEKMHRKAVKLDPNNADLYLGLAKLLRGRGQVDEAEKMYRKAIELDPNLERLGRDK